LRLEDSGFDAGSTRPPLSQAVNEKWPPPKRHGCVVDEVFSNLLIGRGARPDEAEHIELEHKFALEPPWKLLAPAANHSADMNEENQSSIVKYAQSIFAQGHLLGSFQRFSRTSSPPFPLSSPRAGWPIVEGIGRPK